MNKRNAVLVVDFLDDGDSRGPKENLDRDYTRRER